MPAGRYTTLSCPSRTVAQRETNRSQQSQPWVSRTLGQSAVLYMWNLFFILDVVSLCKVYIFKLCPPRKVIATQILKKLGKSFKDCLNSTRKIRAEKEVCSTTYRIWEFNSLFHFTTIQSLFVVFLSQYKNRFGGKKLKKKKIFLLIVKTRAKP